MDGIGRLEVVETGHVVGDNAVLAGDGIEGVASLDKVFGLAR